MLSFASNLKALILFTALVSFVAKPISSQIPTKPNFFGTSCNGTLSGNYTLNGPYHKNLNLVFSDLISHASGAHFYNSSAGGGNSTTAAYGQYTCRGDISSQLCHDCVKAVVQMAEEGGRCFLVQTAFILFQECSLWYDDHSHVGVWYSTWLTGWWNDVDTNVSDPTRFSQVVSSEMVTLIKKAAYGGSEPLGFATGDAAVTQLDTVYCLVQCTPDILGLDCEGCLKGGLRYILSNYLGSSWGMVFYPNCQMRYSLSLFYSANSSDSPPPLSTSPASPPPPAGKRPKSIVVPVVAGAGLILLLFGISFLVWVFFYRKKGDKTSSQTQKHTRDILRDESEIGNIECFSFKTIEEATTKFSQANKLGEGGFGSVYKGIFPEGHVVAIKRLSRNSFQGVKQFKTEVAVVAKLQHRNLVQLMGYCIEDKERILVYEFLPNLSLDKFLFDATQSIKLDWKTRYTIIEGIARGLRYLHIDSLLTIVHRDLKSSNILLDDEMNSKIADFGMAKLVNIDETTGNTSRIAGTYGYMAPEYAMTGRFSIKSDIYSFGVIILEILSGKSISHFYDSVDGDGLLHHAWKIWNEKAIERLVDPNLHNNYSKIEAERCLQIGMLCVQDDATMRPTIRLVVCMLENHSLELPHPSAPSIFFRTPHTSVHSSDNHQGAQHEKVGYYDSPSTSKFVDLRPR